MTDYLDKTSEQHAVVEALRQGTHMVVPVNMSRMMFLAMYNAFKAHIYQDEDGETQVEDEAMFQGWNAALEAYQQTKGTLADHPWFTMASAPETEEDVVYLYPAIDQQPSFQEISNAGFLNAQIQSPASVIRPEYWRPLTTVYPPGFQTKVEK